MTHGSDIILKKIKYNSSTISENSRHYLDIIRKIEKECKWREREREREREILMTKELTFFFFLRIDQGTNLVRPQRPTFKIESP